MSTPTTRSLAWAKGQGFVTQKVEVWNSFARRRVDLFGCIDIVCVGGLALGCLGIQTTSGSNVSARLKKILKDDIVRPKAEAWLKAGNRLVVHGWAKRGKKGKRKMWTLRELWVRREDFDGVSEVSPRQIQDHGVVHMIDAHSEAG